MPTSRGKQRLSSASALVLGLLLVLGMGPAAALAGNARHFTGTYVEIAADARHGEGTQSFLDSAGHWYRLHLPPEAQPKPQSRVSVDGTLKGNRIDARSLTVTAVAPALPAVGSRSLLVILIRWGTATLGTTRAKATGFLFGGDGRSLTNWYRDVSYGQLSWTGDVTPILSIADPGSCNYSAIASSAEAAATAAGYSLAAYTNRMIDFPKGYCSYDGYGEIGGSRSWIQDQLFNLGSGYQRYTPAHELGHNLGLDHAHGIECGPVTISHNCLTKSISNEEYGSSFDPMGNNWPGDGNDAVPGFSVKEMIQLGWFAGRLTTTYTSGTFDISPIELQSTADSQGLEIATAQHQYFVEYRRPLGQDSFLTGYPEATNGVMVSMRDDLPGGDQGPLALDFSPGSDNTCAYCDWYDASLDQGQSYVDVDGTFKLKVNSVSASSARVTVTFIADSSPPKFTRSPSPSFVSAIQPTAVPVKIGWGASDPSGVCSYEVNESVDGGAWAPVALSSPTAVTVIRPETPGTHYQYRARATDCHNNVSSWVEGPSFTPHKAEEFAPTISYAGTWHSQALNGASGGKVMYTPDSATSATLATSATSATYTFNGRAVGFVTVKAPDRGQAEVYVDGTFRKTINMHTLTTGVQVRKVMFWISFAAVGTHTIEIDSVGSRIDVDAFVRLT